METLTSKSFDQQFKNIANEAEAKFKSILKGAPVWGVKSVFFGCVHVTLSLSLSGSPKWCDSIELVYYTKTRWDDEKLATNIASSGDFDILNSDEKAKYYMAIGELLSNKKMLSELKDNMKLYNEKLNALD